MESIQINKVSNDVVGELFVAPKKPVPHSWLRRVMDQLARLQDAEAIRVDLTINLNMATICSYLRIASCAHGYDVEIIPHETDGVKRVHILKLGLADDI